MSNELPQNNNKSEEVDLIVFFNLIGNTFQKLFNWIGSIFNRIFRILILILAHFYKRALWYGVAILIGFMTGFFMDRTSEKLYGANMFIITNYNSGYQVYENISNLNELAGVDKDTKELERIFSLTEEEAMSLKGFYIEPDIDPSERIQMFSDFREGLDSIAKASAKYDDFISNINRFSYKTHRIGVASIDKRIYKKLNNNLPEILSKNPYLEKQKMVGQENYKREENTLREQQKTIDSLVNVYLKIRNDQSNKPANPGSGTNNLYLGNAQDNKLLVNESKLIQQNLILEEQRREVIKKRATEENIVSVISNFPSSGYDIGEWYDSKKRIFPIIASGLLLLVFLFIGLGKFLKKQKVI